MSALVACCLLSGCASSELHKRAAFIQPGVTTMHEVYERLGPPFDVTQDKGPMTLVYVERGRNILECGLSGAWMFTTYTAVLALAAAPFSFGTTLLLIPPATAIGFVGGAAVGPFIEMEVTRLHVQIGDDDKVIKTKRKRPHKKF